MYAPKIKTGLKDGSVILKKAVILETEVDSSLPCTVEWLKDNEPLGPTSSVVSEGRLNLLERKGGFFQASIKNAKEEDAGVYTCIVKNKIGSEQTSSKLEVFTPPIFLQKLDKIDAVENCEAELCVEVSGNPKPTITWLKNSEPVNLSDTKKYEEKINGNFYSLFIKSIAVNDAGTYQCSVSNTAGKASSLGKLTIYPLTAPKFIKSLDETKLFPENENMQLSVQVSGIPVPKIFWFKDGLLLNDEIDKYDLKKDLSKGIYKITGKTTGKGFSGNYQVKASNPGGEINSTCYVRVEGFKPSFIDKPEKIICLEGETAVLGCMVYGVPEPTVKWNLKGKEIALDKNSNKYKTYFDKELNAHFLEITSCGNNDKATYQIVASNEHGSEMAAVSLIISDKIDEVTDYKSGLKITSLSGRNINDSDPDWGKLRKAGAREKSPEDDSNKIKLKHFEMEKQPTEVKETVIDEKSRDSTNIEIKPRTPADLIKLEKTSIIEENIIENEKQNKPSINLSNEELNVSKETNINESIQQNSKLEENDKKNKIIKSLEVEQKQNDVKDGETAAKIIKFLPAILNCKLTENISLDVTISGKPNPKVTWYHEGKELKQNKNYNLLKISDEEYKLVINKMDKLFSGLYTVKVENALGDEKSDCLVCLMQKPEILENLKDASVVENESAEFQLKWASCPSATVQWFEDNIELNSSSEKNETFEILTNANDCCSKLKVIETRILNNNTKTYFAKLTNELGTTESRKSSLTINCK